MLAMTTEGWLILIGFTLGGLGGLVLAGVLAHRARQSDGGIRVLRAVASLVSALCGLAALLVAFALGTCAFGSYGH